MSGGVTLKDGFVTNNLTNMFAIGYNNSLVNFTYDTFWDGVYVGELKRKWYYSANVTDHDLNALSGANVVLLNVSGDVQANLTTKADGLTDRIEIIEYVNNGSGTNFFHYYNDYTMTASKEPTYSSNSSVHNITVDGNIYLEHFSLKIDSIPPNITSIDSDCGVYWCRVNCSAVDNLGVTSYNMSINTNGESASGLSNCDYTFTNLANGTRYNVTINAFDTAGNIATNYTIILTKRTAPKTWTPQGDIDLRERLRILNILDTTWMYSNGSIGECELADSSIISCGGVTPLTGCSQCDSRFYLRTDKVDNATHSDTTSDSRIGVLEVNVSNLDIKINNVNDSLEFEIVYRANNDTEIRTNLTALWDNVESRDNFSEARSNIAFKNESNIFTENQGIKMSPTYELDVNDTIRALNNIIIGNTTGSASFRGLGDYYGLGSVKAMEGLFAESMQYGAGLEILDYNKPVTYTNVLTRDATFTAATELIYDSSASYDASYEDQFMRIISSTPSITGATAEITDVINSTHLALRLSTAGDTPLINLADVTYVIYPHPSLFVGANGVFSVDVGDSSRMEVHQSNGTGFTGVYMDLTAGADQYQGQTIDYVMGNFEGMVGWNIFMDGGDEQIVDKDITMILLEGDASTMNSSNGVFIDMQIIGQPLTADGHMDGIHMPSGLSHLIEVGSSDSLTKSYYESDNITMNVTTAGLLATVMKNNNEYVYFGNEVNFTTINILLETESARNLALEYYYCGDSGWTVLPDVTDTLDGLKTSGTMELESPSDRAKCNTEYDGTPFEDTTEYSYVAIKRTRVQNNVDPVIDMVTISGATTNMYLREDMMKLNPVSTPPVTCDATSEGGLYYDSDDNFYYDCDGSSWSAI